MNSVPNVLTTEPVMVWVGGAVILCPLIMGLLTSFNVPITGAEQVAITALVTGISAVVARSQVTPVSSLSSTSAAPIASKP